MIMVTQEGRRETAEKVYGMVQANKPEPTTQAVTGMDTLLSVVHETGARLGDCLAELGRISDTLLGQEKLDMPPLPPADCLAEELCSIREVTLRIWGRLENMKARLGI